MMTRGILIAIEGIDGSGKHTQAKLLEHSLSAKGFPVYATGFPQYDSWFGSMVGKFLNGDYGPLEEVDPHFSALLYAGDRFESKARIETVLNEGKIVLWTAMWLRTWHTRWRGRAPRSALNFYAGSSISEYSIYGMPREDLILYLRVPPSQAQMLVSRKSERKYTQATHDIQEKAEAPGRRGRNVRHAFAQPAVGHDSVLRRAEQYPAAAGRYRRGGHVRRGADAGTRKEGVRHGIFGVPG